RLAGGYYDDEGSGHAFVVVMLKGASTARFGRSDWLKLTAWQDTQSRRAALGEGSGSTTRRDFLVPVRVRHVNSLCLKCGKHLDREMF
ncbi:MAG TPA: hypothetical protein VFB24_09190, partial [Candidatus Binatia bacterium]|nr:hypothetical protein [Candidatus Binatia bacterium]